MRSPFVLHEFGNSWSLTSNGKTRKIWILVCFLSFFIHFWWFTFFPAGRGSSLLSLSPTWLFEALQSNLPSLTFYSRLIFIDRFSDRNGLKDEFDRNQMKRSIKDCIYIIKIRIVYQRRIKKKDFSFWDSNYYRSIFGAKWRYIFKLIIFLSFKIPSFLAFFFKEFDKGSLFLGLQAPFNFSKNESPVYRHFLPIHELERRKKLPLVEDDEFKRS